MATNARCPLNHTRRYIFKIYKVPISNVVRGRDTVPTVNVLPIHFILIVLQVCKHLVEQSLLLCPYGLYVIKKIKIHTRRVIVKVTFLEWNVRKTIIT